MPIFVHIVYNLIYLPRVGNKAVDRKVAKIGPIVSRYEHRGMLFDSQGYLVVSHSILTHSLGEVLSFWYASFRDDICGP